MRQHTDGHWDFIEDPIREKVLSTIGQALESGQDVAREMDGNVFAAGLQPDGTIGWSISGISPQSVIFEGGMTGAEFRLESENLTLRDYLAQTREETTKIIEGDIERLKSDLEDLKQNPDAYKPYLEGGTLSPVEQLQGTIAQHEFELQYHKEGENHQRDEDIIELARQLYKNAPQANSSEQKVNDLKDLVSNVSQLAPHEFVGIQELVEAGHDEAAFHQSITDLRDNAELTSLVLSNIAGIYSGTDHLYRDRDTALGAIETHFYDNRKQQTQEQSAARGSR